MIDPNILKEILIAYGVEATFPLIKKTFNEAFKIKPELEKSLEVVKSKDEFEKVFNEARGIIEASAGLGSIDINNSELKAIREIKFNHEDGKVDIQNSQLFSEKIQMGGKGNGKTTVIDSISRTPNTQMKISGPGAKFEIKGNAQFKQEG